MQLTKHIPKPAAWCAKTTGSTCQQIKIDHATFFGLSGYQVLVLRMSRYWAIRHTFAVISLVYDAHRVLSIPPQSIDAACLTAAVPDC